MCIYVCVAHNSSACHAYVMWVELGHSHFLHVPTISNVVTTGNGTGTKNVLKWNLALGFEFSILRHYYFSEITISTWTRSTVSFYSM